MEAKTLIEFARYSDALEIGSISKKDIEYGLGWKYTPERVVRLIDDDVKNVVVARIKSDLAGFGIMTYYQDHANLDLLAVKPNLRRMRIGTQVVSWLEKVAITAGVCNIFVQVRARNKGAVQFYECLNFSVLSVDKTYYQGVEAGIIMVKNLRCIFDAV